MAVSIYTLVISKQKHALSFESKCLIKNISFMKKLENYRVQELNTREINNTHGGFLGLIVAAVITGYHVEKYKETGTVTVWYGVEIEI